jgi:hypothetical protein
MATIIRLLEPHIHKGHSSLTQKTLVQVHPPSIVCPASDRRHLVTNSHVEDYSFRIFLSASTFPLASYSSHTGLL